MQISPQRLSSSPPLHSSLVTRCNHWHKYPGWANIGCGWIFLQRERWCCSKLGIDFQFSHFICFELLGELYHLWSRKNGILMGFPPNIGTFDNYSVWSRQNKIILQGKKNIYPCQVRKGNCCWGERLVMCNVNHAISYPAPSTTITLGMNNLKKIINGDLILYFYEWVHESVPCSVTHSYTKSYKIIFVLFYVEGTSHRMWQDTMFDNKF